MPEKRVQVGEEEGGEVGGDEVFPPPHHLLLLLFLRLKGREGLESEEEGRVVHPPIHPPSFFSF